MRLIFVVLLAHLFLLLRGEDKKKESQTVTKDEGNVISLWNGRIIVSLNKKKKEEKEESKNFKVCTASTGKIGICTRLSHCNGFNLSSLYNNICFMDIFLPGVCCAQNIDKSPFIPILPYVLTTETPNYSEGNQVVSGNNKAIEISNKKFISKLDGGCGLQTIPSSRIIHGSESPSGKWPWMAAIYTNTLKGQKFHCGGSLISSKHILTGAHCLKDPHGRTFSTSQIIVRLGDNDITTLNKNDDKEQGRFYRVQSISTHPEFQNINHYFMNDVAVLKLSTEVAFSDFVFPICLPPMSSENEPLDKFAGKLSTVIGYGKNEFGVPSGKLMEADVPIWHNHACDSSYFAPITDIFICAGHRMGGKDACQGDSGGPLQIEIDNRWTQIGITSFGKGCGEAGFPGVYARLGKFVRWIRKNMS